MSVIGIDVSKPHLDVVLLDDQGKTLEEKRIENTPSALRRTLKGWIRSKRCADAPLVCLEPTGHYSTGAVKTLLEMAVPVWIAHPANIMNSGGMQRGKNDEVDALRIAQYAFRFKDQARLVGADFVRLGELKELLTTRDRLVRDLGKYKGQMNDNVKYMAKGSSASAKVCFKQVMKALGSAIAKAEKAIEAFIAEDEMLFNKRALAMSVTGIGPVLAHELLVVTQGFTRFDTPRQLACYAGTAPFEHSSGTSVKGSTRVSHRANKSLKTLLHMAALTAIRIEGDLRTYYLRKVAEGKNKMRVINAVRTKIIHHLWAVITSGTPYTRFKNHLQMS